jgi:hypothetical protein
MVQIMQMANSTHFVGFSLRFFCEDSDCSINSCSDISSEYVLIDLISKSYKILFAVGSVEFIYLVKNCVWVLVSSPRVAWIFPFSWIMHENSCFGLTIVLVENLSSPSDEFFSSFIESSYSPSSLKPTAWWTSDSAWDRWWSCWRGEISPRSLAELLRSLWLLDFPPSLCLYIEFLARPSCLTWIRL